MLILPKVFGNTQPAQPQAGGGLFGTTNLFGNTTGQQQTQQPAQQNPFAGSIFGQKPATTTAPAMGGGLFGNLGQTNTTNTQPAGGGLFGSTLGQSTAQQPGATGGAFGASLFGKPAAPAFGAAQSTTQPGLGASLFGGGLGASTNLNASTAVPGAQGSLTASIAQPIGANLPIFSMLPPGPRAITLDPPKKKSSIFADMPTRSPVPRFQLGYTPTTSKLRGFSSSTSTNGQLGASLAFSTGNPNALALSRTGEGVGTEAFFSGSTSTASLGSGGRQSVKKLVLDKKVDAADIMNKAGGRASPGAFKKGANKVNFSPALGIAAREKEVAAERGATAVVPQKSTGTRFNAQGASTDSVEPGSAKAPEAAKSDKAELKKGDYYVKPSLEKLKSLSYDELSSFSGLVVGCVGKGEISFLQPVNLTAVPRLQELLGGIVAFGEQDCTIYQDYDEADRPPPGQGINVAARIELLGNWPRDRATKGFLKDLDESDPAMRKFLKRLRSIPNTKFESYEQKTGKWTFTIDHY